MLILLSRPVLRRRAEIKQYSVNRNAKPSREYILSQLVFAIQEQKDFTLVSMLTLKGHPHITFHLQVLQHLVKHPRTLGPRSSPVQLSTLFQFTVSISPTFQEQHTPFPKTAISIAKHHITTSSPQKSKVQIKGAGVRDPI